MVGTILGDGYAFEKKTAVRYYNDIKIGLEVKDKDFAYEFARCLGKVLGRSPKNPDTTSRKDMS